MTESEPHAYVIATTETEALGAFRRWVHSGQTHSLKGERMCFKGEADARYLLAQHLQKDDADSSLRIWKIKVEAEVISLAPSVTGIPPYRDGDIITVYDREYGIKYAAKVTEVLLAGAGRPWTVCFESLKPIEPNDSRHYVGSLEADDDGTSPYIVKEE